MAKEPRPDDARRFRRIVNTIRKNRVQGFEALRDQILLDYELLTKSMPAYSALKIAIEADRHALFAKVAGTSGVSESDKQQYADFMHYLSGAVEISAGTAPKAAPGRIQALIERRVLLDPDGLGPGEDSDDAEPGGGTHG